MANLDFVLFYSFQDTRDERRFIHGFPSSGILICDEFLLVAIFEKESFLNLPVVMFTECVCFEIADFRLVARDSIDSLTLRNVFY